MPVKESYDFLNFVSFPSSLRLENDTGYTVTPKVNYIPLKGPGKVRVECMVKVKGGYPAEKYNDKEMSAWVGFGGRDANRKFVEDTYGRTYPLVIGDQDWVKVVGEANMTPEVVWLAFSTDPAGSGTPGKVAYTWFDDLKIYLDGKLIYEDNFSNWNLYLGSIPVVVVGGVIGFNEAKKLIKI